MFFSVWRISLLLSPVLAAVPKKVPLAVLLKSASNYAQTFKEHITRASLPDGRRGTVRRIPVPVDYRELLCCFKNPFTKPHFQKMAYLLHSLKLWLRIRGRRVFWKEMEEISAFPKSNLHPDRFMCRGSKTRKAGGKYEKRKQRFARPLGNGKD